MFAMSRRLRVAAIAVSALALGGIMAGPSLAQDKLVILGSVPGLKFPFFVHMMNQIKAEGEKLGVEVIVGDGQVSSTKQTADVEAAISRGVNGIVISPNEVDAMAPALQEAVDAGIPVVTIDRNKGLHNILDQHKDKYEIVFEQTAEFDRVKGLSVTEAALAGMQTPPDVIVAANDDMILGAMEAVKAHNLGGKIALIGFDALPEALARVKDGSLTATVEQFPGLQSSKAVDKLVAFLKDGTKPEPKVELLTPITITKDNLDKAERLGEIQ